MRGAARAAVGVGLGVALFALAGLFGSSSSLPSPPSAFVPVPVDAVLTPDASLPDRIASLQDRLRSRPDDARALAALGIAYVQQARVGADPGAYPRAEEALERSLTLQPPGNLEAHLGMGVLDLARHDFAAALVHGREAVSLNPYGGAGYGVLGDALLELGRYDEAFRTFQTMVDTDPDASAYARASYALELQGDVAGAIRAMELARDAAGTLADAAWASHQLGQLHASGGRLRSAAEAYRRSIDLAPALVPPRAGLAKVAWARGRTEQAIRRLTWVVARSPMPEYVVALGDLYTVSGRTDLADEQYALARAERELFRANGVNVDLELALFDADHGSPRRALVAARAEWSRRRSVHVADALAWALHANGRDAEALRYSRLSLRLGTRDASFLYHAALIHHALGNAAEARDLLAEALAIDPHFSYLHAAEAADLLERLRGSS
jgi:tetratricopeptide (TPR) repeat protein